VAKRMPRKFLRDPQLLSDRLDVISHHGTQPYWLFSAFRSGPFGISSPNVVDRFFMRGHRVLFRYQ
jgi:hypothetical protein